MKVTRHAEQRSHQRGIRDELAMLVLLFGRDRKRPGGARELRIDRRDLPEVRRGLKRLLELLDQASGIGVLLDREGENVITMYHTESKR